MTSEVDLARERLITWLLRTRLFVKSDAEQFADALVELSRALLQEKPKVDAR